MNKKSSMHSSRKNKWMLLVLMIVLGLSLSVFVFGGARAKADPEASQRYYTSIIIQPGDSLWSIACQYAPQFADIQDYIDQLIQINGLSRNDTLPRGKSLIIIRYQ